MATSICGRLLLNTVNPCKISVSNICKDASVYQSLKWNLFGALLLERKPVISRPLTPLESEFQQLLSTLELESGLLNDHELRHMEDTKRKERLLSSSVTEADLEAATIQTAQDYEDGTSEQFERFKPASRTVSPDENNDRHSLKRHLDRSLLLLTKVKHSNEWEVPSVLHCHGNTLRQTAQKCLSQYFKPTLNVVVIGNAPVGFYQFKYNKKLRKTDVVNNGDGGKVFLFRTYYVKGVVKMNEDCQVEDYMWATRSELDDIFKSKPTYLNSLKSALTDEDFDYQASNGHIIRSSISAVRSRV